MPFLSLRHLLPCSCLLQLHFSGLLQQSWQQILLSPLGTSSFIFTRYQLLIFYMLHILLASECIEQSRMYTTLPKWPLLWKRHILCHLKILLCVCVDDDTFCVSYLLVYHILLLWSGYFILRCMKAFIVSVIFVLHVLLRYNRRKCYTCVLRHMPFLK